ncbi:MAG: hypothetical protein LUD69_04680 [Oscillospiraceae bacterium]|nr:hypothetical protein [Oscillospiraceae bacterium]
MTTAITTSCGRGDCIETEKVSDINALESESGVIATLIQHPDYVLFSEDYLFPEHFTNAENKCVYMAIRNMAQNKGVFNADPYNIISYLNSSNATKEYANILTVDKLNELRDMSYILCRHTPEEYNMLCDNVVDAAFRRKAFMVLDQCQGFCRSSETPNLGQQIYNAIDGVIGEFSYANDIPKFKDVIDDCWEEIKSRQSGEYAGIPFKFKTLNQYATIEPGELFLFAAGPKEGKSIMLLNCAVDLLKKDLSVLYLDSELGTRLFTARLLSHLSGVEYRRLTSGNYTEEEAQRIDEQREWLKTRKLTHIYMPIFDTQSVYSAAKKVKHSPEGLDVLIVDYFKASGQNDAFATYQELGRFVDMVKNNLAGGMKICALGAVQTTSSGKIADSAKISRNASTIAIMENKTPEEIEADGPECGNKKLRVVLNRNGMQHAEGEYISLNFNGNLISFEEAKQAIPQMPY